GAQFWYPRYLLFPLPPLILAAVGGWQCLLARVPRLRQPLSLGLLLLCLILMGHQTARIILDPPAARWSPLDRLQYFQGWSSGYGYPEAARFLLKTDAPPAVVFSLDGHSAWQLQSYLPAQSALHILFIAYGPDGRSLQSPEARFENLWQHSPAWIVIPVPLV